MFPVHNPVLIFAIVMAIVLIAPLVFERFRVPGIIGLIVAGIVVGPYALGILERDSTMELLGAVGLLYIMFIAGLEIDLDQFARQRGHSIVFGALTFFIPLVSGTLMGYYALAMALPAAVLLASMFSSHTLVTYPIVSRLGLAKARSVTTAIGGTIITDTAALMVLAVIAGMVADEGVDAQFWFRMLTLMAVYVTGVFMLLPKIGRWFFQRLDPDGVTEYVFVLTSVFVCAWLAYAAGLEPIIGAFLAGLILNRLIPGRSALMNRIQFVGHALFIPFFLITVGMLVNLRLLLAGFDVWKFAVAMLLCAIVTKWFASGLTRWLLRYEKQEGRLIFGLSVNQAAATLAAVMVGYRLELFDEAVLTGTVFMIMGTCFMGSWITGIAGRMVALMMERQPYNPADAPQRIMVPLANPSSAAALINLACMLRKPKSAEPLYPLTVIPEGGDSEARVAEGERLLGNALVHAIAANVPTVPVTRVDVHTASAILSAMRDYRVSTVIAGWDGGQSTRQRVFGRVLDTLVEQSRQMVIIACGTGPLNTTRRLVLTLPPLVERHVGLELGMHTVKVLAQQLGARLAVVAAPETMEKVCPVIDGTRPDMEFEQLVVNRWNMLPFFLARNLREGDLIVLVGVRKGRLAWQPLLDHLPAQFSRELKGHDFLVFYLPESQLDEEYGIPLPLSGSVAAHLLPPERARLDLDGYSYEDAVRTLLKGTFGVMPDVLERLSRRLIRIGREEPVELAPGAVLLHTHTSDVAAPTVHLGVNRSGFDMPQSTQPPQVLFLLLSPSDQTPESHLQMLALIARWVRRSKSIETICSAKDFADLPPLTPPPFAD